MTDAELERLAARGKADAAMSQHLDRTEADAHGRAADASLARARTGAPPASPPDTRPPMSVEQVAAMLGLHRSEVMELVHKGKLPAKRIGAGTFITAANLAAFVAKTDPGPSFPRFERGALVVWMDEGGKYGLGRFVAENADGSVRVLRDGFLGAYETAFPASQVQAFTCRIPANRTQ